jgi:hypothetical protein
MAPTVKNIELTPRHAPGKDVAKVLKGTVRHIRSSFAFGDTTPVIIAEFPNKAVYVTRADLHVSTAFEASGASAAATCTITIPNSSGAQTIFDAASTKLQSTGVQPSTAVGITTDTGGNLNIVYTASTTTAGAAEIYVEYMILDD